MKLSYPSISEYNQLFQKFGGEVFKELKGINLIASRTLPIKVFLFGSGAYAAVFKGSFKGEVLALRCFLSVENENINRSEIIAKYLKGINAPWKTDIEFLKDEILFKENWYPILKMEWVEGMLINDFISQNITNKNVLTRLQNNLLAISNSLEENYIGHGDLQCGNIMVTGTSSDFNIRLIDYDGMFVPALMNIESLENGRSEFQHPKRTNRDFGPEMDRFSFWVMITALEAVKYDASLWLEVMQGGFNTLDNFLFTSQDFINPSQSKLFSRLYGLNQSSLKFYIDKLISFCNVDTNNVAKVTLYANSQKTTVATEIAGQTSLPVENINLHKSVGMYKLISKGSPLNILTSTFQNLGATPIELEKAIFKGKTIIVSNGSQVNQLLLSSDADVIEVSLDEQFMGLESQTVDINKEYKVDNKNIEKELPRDSNLIVEENLASQNVSSSTYNTKTRPLQKKPKASAFSSTMIYLGIILIILCGGVFFILKFKDEQLENDIIYDNQEVQIEDKEIVPAIVDEVNNEKPSAASNTYDLTDDEQPSQVLGTNALANEEQPSTVSNTYVLTNEDYHSIIKDFLKAEDERDFIRIDSYFSSNLKRYYNLNYPTYANLKSSYQRSWRSTSNSENTIYSIYSINSAGIYNVETLFKYFDLKKERIVKSMNTVRFDFDENGYIIRLYTVSSKILENNFSSPTSEEISESANNDNNELEGETYYGSYKYIATVNVSDISVYAKPSVAAKVIYTCSKGDKIYVIENEYTGNFNKVFVDGKFGYIGKVWLERKY